IADIAGTSPKLWNSWKDRLLADLYVAARFVLRGDLARPARAETRVRASRGRVATLLREQGRDAPAVRNLLDDFPDHAFLRQSDAQIVSQAGALLDAPDQLLVVSVHPRSPRGGTEVFVCAPDRDGVFASVVATLDRARCSVMEARVLGTRSGRALDAFTVLDAENLAPLGEERARELRASLLRALAPNAEPAQPTRRGLARRLKHFQRPPRIDFADAAEAARTRLALVCSDQPGLLARVAQGFLETGVRVHDARIATFGERVEDFFELTDHRDLPLDSATQDALRAALLRRLGVEGAEHRENHARA
ncbi:MAG: ACT domain-containing protein, partial [Rhodanobacteraceae bacterium]